MRRRNGLITRPFAFDRAMLHGECFRANVLSYGLGQSKTLSLASRTSALPMGSDWAVLGGSRRALLYSVQLSLIECPDHSAVVSWYNRRPSSRKGSCLIDRSAAVALC